MKKKLYLGVGIILVLIITVSVFGYSMFNRYAPTSYVVETNTGTTTVNSTTGGVTAGAKTFTLADIATHKDATSCYSVISGVAYDLTMWVNLHPGGKKAILSLCGTDGTERFMNKHHGGAKFMEILARFKIGTLTQ